MHGMLETVDTRPPETTHVGFQCFDITDLLRFLRHSHTVTGIQRVQMETTRAVLAQPDIKAMCCFFSDDGIWQIIDNQVFLDVFDDFGRGAPGWKTRLDALLADSINAPTYRFSAGDTLLCLGATWNIQGMFESLRQLQFDGVDCVIYMHDLLPLTHPEYFEEKHVIEFGYWFTNALQVASGLICNSEETRDAVLALSGYAGQIDVVELNVDPGSIGALPKDGALSKANPTPRSTSNVLTRYTLERENFALMVGTLEPRKNHVTAFNAWMALDKALGNRCPTLVVVGKKGWKSEGIVAHLESLNRHGRIIWIDDANDNDLAALYDNCLCALYLSRGEGWGLPVSEALAAGKPVVCGERSSAARATQDLAITVDECSERDVINTLIDLFSDRPKLADLATKVAATATFKTWDDFGDQILAKSAPMCSGARQGTLRQMAVGQSYVFGHHTYFADLDIDCFADGLLWGNCWHRAEPWGIWSSQAKGELRFALPDAQCYDAYLRMVMPQAEAQISVLRDGQVIAQKSVRGPTLVKVKIEPDPENPYVSLTLQADSVTNMSKHQEGGDQRLLGFGLAEIRFVRSDDLHGRLDALERFL